jgi:hypothetical protein
MIMGSALVSGCASVTEGESQQIQVTTDPVAGASCLLTNGRGAWPVTTPGAVIVKKSESVLKAHCSKDGWKDATAYLASNVPVLAQAGMMIPYLGVVSAAVDASTGAANKYPDQFKIVMKPLSANPEPGTPAAAPAPQSTASAKPTQPAQPIQPTGAKP